MKGFERQAEVLGLNVLVTVVLASSSGLCSHFPFSVRPVVTSLVVSKADKNLYPRGAFSLE